MAVHLFGLPADTDALRAALPDGTLLIEDAACAAGAEYGGRPVGGIGDIAAFSFHPRKSITTGEGGMVTTSDSRRADLCRVLRNHGASVSEEERHRGPAPWLLPDFEVLGFNYRMTDLQGAIGLVQLGRLDGLLSERREWAAWYRAELDPIEWLQVPSEPEGYRHGWQAFVTVVGEEAPVPRDEIMARLSELGIATRPGTHAVTELAYWRRALDLSPGSAPVAARLECQTLTLPLHNRMQKDDYAYVVDALRALDA
jgi:dTDP-4-amino-4,6-dideoxygalactose transaminase